MLAVMMIHGGLEVGVLAWRAATASDGAVTAESKQGCCCGPDSCCAEGACNCAGDTPATVPIPATQGLAVIVLRADTCAPDAAGAMTTWGGAPTSSSFRFLAQETTIFAWKSLAAEWPEGHLSTWRSKDLGPPEPPPKLAIG